MPRDRICLIELQEVPAALDEHGLALVGQYPPDPGRVVLGAAVVGAVQIQRRQPRRVQPMLVELRVLSGRSATADRRTVVPERGTPPLGRADCGPDMTQGFRRGGS